MAYVTNRAIAQGVMVKEAPKVQIQMHFNKAYILFDFPSKDSNDSDIYVVSLRIYEYSSEDRLPENQIGSSSVEFAPYMTQQADNNSEVPLHHMYQELNNNWYTFKFSYVYSPSVDASGSALFYSKVSNTFIDNSTPIIYEKFMAPYIKSDFRRHLEQRKVPTMWWDTTPYNYAVKDIINQNGRTSLLSIEQIYPDLSFYTRPASMAFKNAFLRIITHTDFSKVIELYFKDTNVPEDGEIAFKFTFNHNKYYVLFKGNLNKLIEGI